LVVALALAACASRPDWTKAARFVPYTVEGKFTENVAADILRKGPIVDGEHKAATTVYVFIPRPEFMAVWVEDGPSSCACTESIHDVAVDLHLGVSYPQWRDYGASLKVCQTAWEQYLKSLRRHEDGHVRISLKHRDLWRRRLRGLSRTAYGPDCTAACGAALVGLVGDMDKVSGTAAEAHRLEQKAYDQAHQDALLLGCAHRMPEHERERPQRTAPY
jgi:predicted secreted Zn-dependent protease